MTNAQEIHSSPFAASLGTEISIQLGEGGKKFKTLLVGMQHEDYLIVRLPQPAFLSKKLPQGMGLILRYVHNGSVYGCMASVAGLIVRPFPLLFLTFPTEVQRIELRKGKRVECMLPARVTGVEKTVDGMIRDISTGGVLFSVKTDSSRPAPPFGVGESILVSFPLLGMEGVREFSGKIRRVAQDGQEGRLGIQFETLAEEIARKIESYIETITTFNPD